MLDPIALADHAREIAREARKVAEEADDIAADALYEADTAKRLTRLAAHAVDWREYVTLIRQETRSRRVARVKALLRLAAVTFLV